MCPVDPGSNPVVSMLQRALRLSVSAGRQTQLIMNRSWSRTLIVALLHWLDYKTLQLLLLLDLSVLKIEYFLGCAVGGISMCMLLNLDVLKNDADVTNACI